MHAVRQADVRIGDQVAVIGQGLIGLLVTDLCRLAGARVLAIDVVQSREQLSKDLGAEEFVVTGAQDVKEAVHSWTGGRGVDSVFVCTALSTNTPVVQAAEVARDRGRVIIVGITNSDLPRQVFYDKELDLRFSRSYGPGRYDPSYEWAGQDYPLGHVRWTETRNFEACLQLMRGNSLKLDRLTSRRVPFGESISVYEELAENVCEDIGIVIDYDGPDPDDSAVVSGGIVSAPPEAIVRLKTPVERLDVIGAGNFAKTMLLPHVHKKIVFGTVVNQRALSAAHAGRKFGFERNDTDPESIFASDQPSATLIATRHHLHAPLVIESVNRDRQVFVEKPLCMTPVELEEIDQAMSEHPEATVQVGFNRRFSPASRSLKKLADSVPGPKTVVYTVVAGRLDPTSWYADPREGGGRIIGEACHFFDYFVFLVGSKPVAVSARTLWPTGSTNGLADSISAQVDFEDGSCAILVYHAEAGTKYPKEIVRLFAAGVTGKIDNFKSMETYTRTRIKKERCSSKGHAEQMAAWLAYLNGAEDHPLPYAEARDSMLLTFRALEAIRAGSRVDFGDGSGVEDK
jgi:predicted dehydrogenase